MRRDRSARRLRRDPWSRLLVAAGLAAFVGGTYVALVVGGGALTGQADRPNLLLSFLATVVVALAFERVQGRIETAVSALLGRQGASPYDVLSRFSEAVTGGSADDGIPARMARLLAEGTGVAWAQVWLVGPDALELAACWPEGSGPSEPPQSQANSHDQVTGVRCLAVRHGGQVYGVFRLQERAGSPLTIVEERLAVGLASQAGLVLRRLALGAQLTARHHELAARAAELVASRERLIATQDAERRRLERDIHDGAQQHLVALAVHLRLAVTVAAKEPERASRLLAEQLPAARTALDTLSDLSRGMYPRLLAEDGLAAALRSAVQASPVPVVVSSGSGGRAPSDIEAALYFVAMEAVQNAAKHAAATVVHVEVQHGGGVWRVSVRDDGVGFTPGAAGAESAGAGLANMADRLDDVGGTVVVTSSPGGGTTVTAEVVTTAAPLEVG